MNMTGFPVLCGGTFFTLLLEAANQGRNERKKWGECSEFSESDVFEALIRVAMPNYKKPSDNDNFKSAVSAYKSCNSKKSGRLPFHSQACISTFDNCVKNDYLTPLFSMNALVEKFIDIDGKGIWLIRALLDLALKDGDIKTSDRLYVCQDGRPSTKSSLSGITEACLPAVLLGFWHYIIVNKVNNGNGRETYNEWCRPGESPNTREPFQSSIGDGITQQISNSLMKPAKSSTEETDAANKGAIELSAANVDVQSTMRAEKQPEPKSLLDLFEDAIDKYNIAVFVDSDFTAMPLYFDDVVAVDEFIEVLRGKLRIFRRKQDSTYRYVISFINTLGHYQGFLSERMICDDGETIHWLRNIDWSEVHEVTLSLRRELNKLYGLISGGGSLSVFGYTEPNDNESESGESNESSGASTDTNSQIVNNSNAVLQQNTLQIENPEISREYYNLFVISDEIKNNRFTIPKDRSLRSSVATNKKFAEYTPEAISQIKTFPSLFMYENTEFGGRTSPDQKAYFGFVTDLRVQENGLIKVRFHCVGKINQQQINDIARLLDIHEGSGIMELNHTHWTIKNVDLIEELTEAELLPQEEFSLRRLP